MAHAFDPISDSRALSEKIIIAITDAMVGGELKPGDRLAPERELAEQFKVSRTVVRDAVKTLAGRGILRVIHGKGIFMATSEDIIGERLDVISGSLSLRGDSLRDLFEMRKVLETQATEWAAKRGTKLHTEHLRDLVRDALAHADDPGILSQRDAQFHVGVAEASQNLVLVRVMLMLLDLLAQARRDSLSIPGRARLSLTQHQRIIKAIESKDPDQARRAMLSHLRSVETSIRPDKKNAKRGRKSRTKR